MAAGTTYSPIATTTLGSAAASYTFSSIPSTYTDLVLVATGTGSSNTGLYLQFNGDSGSNYSLTVAGGSGTAATSERQTSVGYARFVWNSLWNTSVPSIATVNIQGYSNTGIYKTMLWRSNTSSNAVEIGINLWRSTAAINSITITGSSANIAAGSTFTLYGITAA
jgi:hypothetical protein